MSPDEDITTKIPDGFKITQIFRNQVHLGSYTKGAFSAATLQGEEAPSDGRNQNQNGQKRQKCVKGHSKHTPDQCYYLNKDLRPDGWRWRPEGAELVFQGLKQNKKLQDRYKNAYKELESFLED